MVEALNKSNRRSPRVRSDEAIAFAKAANKLALSSDAGAVEQKEAASHLLPQASTTAQQVQQLLVRHDISQDPGRPRERVLLWVARAERALSTLGDISGPLDVAQMNALRREFFALEGLMRLYVERYPPLDKWLERFKQIEDALGAFDFAVAMHAAGKKVSAKLPQDVRGKTLRWLQQEVERTQEDVKKLLRKHWLPFAEKPATPRVVADLLDLEWDNLKVDRAFLQKALARMVEAAQDKEYDLDEWETGIHELRRQLRWFPICAAALDGLVVLSSSENPVPEYKELLTQPIAQSPYSQLPVSTHEPRPILLSRSLFIRNTQAIQDIGAEKDKALEYRGLRAALEEGAGLEKGEAKELAQAATGLTGKKRDEMKQRVDDSYHELMEHTVLHHIAQEFRDA